MSIDEVLCPEKTSFQMKQRFRGVDVQATRVFGGCMTIKHTHSALNCKDVQRCSRCVDVDDETSKHRADTPIHVGRIVFCQSGQL